MTLLVDIGAGDRPFEDGRGWTHLDSRELPDIEVVGYADDLNVHFELESVDVLRAAHILEHFSHRRVGAVLESWLDVLKPGGELIIEVPNLGWQVAAMAGLQDRQGKSLEEITVLMFGEQDHSDNYHYNGFTWTTLRNTLRRAGFEDVSITDIGMVLLATAKKPNMSASGE